MKIITEERRRNSFCGNLHPDGPLFQYSQSDRPARQQHGPSVFWRIVGNKSGLGTAYGRNAEGVSAAYENQSMTKRRDAV